VSRAAFELCRFEFGMIVAWNAVFSRGPCAAWRPPGFFAARHGRSRRAGCLHHITTAARNKKLATSCFVMNSEARRRPYVD